VTPNQDIQVTIFLSVRYLENDIR